MTLGCFSFLFNSLKASCLVLHEPKRTLLFISRSIMRVRTSVEKAKGWRRCWFVLFSLVSLRWWSPLHLLIDSYRSLNACCIYSLSSGLNFFCVLTYILHKNKLWRLALLYVIISRFWVLLLLDFFFLVRTFLLSNIKLWLNLFIFFFCFWFNCAIVWNLQSFFYFYFHLRWGCLINWHLRWRIRWHLSRWRLFSIASSNKTNGAPEKTRFRFSFFYCCL